MCCNFFIRVFASNECHGTGNISGTGIVWKKMCNSRERLEAQGDIMKIRWISLIVLPALVLAGCSQGKEIKPLETQIPPSLEEQNPSPNSTQPVEVPPLSTPQPDSPAQGDSMLNPTDPDIQKLIEIATEDLSKRFSIPADQVRFKEVMEVVWQDSSLGCPNTDSSYIQVLTPGYLIRMQAGDRTFEYHTDKKGAVAYCENPAVLPLDSLPDR
jgi:hypothetical protein